MGNLSAVGGRGEVRRGLRPPTVYGFAGRLLGVEVRWNACTRRPDPADLLGALRAEDRGPFRPRPDAAGRFLGYFFLSRASAVGRYGPKGIFRFPAGRPELCARSHRVLGPDGCAGSFPSSSPGQVLVPICIINSIEQVRQAAVLWRLPVNTGHSILQDLL